jgi:hypothetical protein
MYKHVWLVSFRSAGVGSRYKSLRCKLLTRILALFIVATLASMGTTLLNRAWSTIQGSGAGAPLNIGSAETSPSVLNAVDVSNLTAMAAVELEPPDQEDLKRL